MLDAGDDGREVVVEEHEVGRLAGDVGARAPHRDADVGLVERGTVVHAVSGHGHDVPASAQRPSDAQLLLGRHPGDHDAVVVEQRPEDLLVRGQIGADEHRRVRCATARPRSAMARAVSG